MQSFESPAPPRLAVWPARASGRIPVEHFANGNTGWRCTVCGQILRLIPGRYEGDAAEERA